MNFQYFFGGGQMYASTEVFTLAIPLLLIYGWNPLHKDEKEDNSKRPIQPLLTFLITHGCLPGNRQDMTARDSGFEGKAIFPQGDVSLITVFSFNEHIFQNNRREGKNTIC